MRDRVDNIVRRAYNLIDVSFEIQTKLIQNHVKVKIIFITSRVIFFD